MLNIPNYRHERLDKDWASFVADVNGKLPESLTLLDSTLGHARRSSQVDASNSSSTDDPALHAHVFKYSECGAPCVQAIRTYFADDLKLLQYG